MRDDLVLEEDNQYPVLIGRDFWLPENTAQDLTNKLNNLDDILSKYYIQHSKIKRSTQPKRSNDNPTSRDYLRL